VKPLGHFYSEQPLLKIEGVRIWQRESLSYIIVSGASEQAMSHDFKLFSSNFIFL
jgi:hypothetical protein